MTGSGLKALRVAQRAAACPGPSTIRPPRDRRDGERLHNVDVFLENLEPAVGLEPTTC
jgi:hypothetical protein